jgi:hypothetical protein
LLSADKSVAYMGLIKWARHVRGSTQCIGQVSISWWHQVLVVEGGCRVVHIAQHTVQLHRAAS